MPKPKAVRAADPVDTASLSIAELFAHYKKTAIAEDLRFFLGLPLSEVLRARAELIASSKPTARYIASLRAEWRTERENHDRFCRIPALGSPAWRASILSDEPATDEPEAIAV